MFYAQHARLNFYTASSLKQQSTGRNVDQLGHIILSQDNPVCFYSLMLHA